MLQNCYNAVGVLVISMKDIKLDLDKTSQFLKLIANSNRLAILELLTLGGSANVSEMEQHMGVSQPALSQHLARMRQEGILEANRSGQQIFYSIKDERIVEMLKLLDELFKS
jgi:ArsR family transcriptional regulator, virulence genes transcriptional regulator